MVEMEKAVVETKRRAEMANKMLMDKLALSAKQYAVERRKHEKAMQEMTKDLEAMREKVSLLTSRENETISEPPEAAMQVAFEEKLKETERIWIQRLDHTKREHKQMMVKNQEQANLRLKEVLRERNALKMKVQQLGNEKDVLEYQVESCIFKAYRTA